MKASNQNREQLGQARRIVVKVGSRVLVQRNGRPDARRMAALVQELAELHHGGKEVVLVTSGAVGAGIQALGLKRRPTTMPDLQMAAAVGQSRLMAAYSQLFEKQKCRIGQMLLTHSDLKDRRRHLNARNTMMNLLRHDIVPIVNENDVVTTEEIKFGDNDMLAAMVSILMPADLMILLTTTDGLREPTRNGRTRRIPEIERVTPEILALATGKGGDFSTGGMASKLEAAQTAADVGIPVVIADGRKATTIRSVVAGNCVGTLLQPAARQTPSARKRWIAFFHKAQGALIVDDGAVEALVRKGRSLLPIGIREVEGEFDIGALVNVRTRDGTTIARGLVDYPSGQVRQIQGKRSSQIKSILGTLDYDEVIHRDNMVLVE